MADYRVEALNHLFKQYRLDVLLGNELCKRGQRYCLVLVDANRKSHVDCGVHGIPIRLDTRGDPLLTRVSCSDQRNFWVNWVEDSVKERISTVFLARGVRKTSVNYYY